MTTLQRAEAAEHALSQELDKIAVKSVIYTSGERDPREPMPRPDAKGRRFLMGHDARLAQMPDKPTLIDFYRLRFGPSMHVLQSARLALKSGAPEKVVVACLLHDIAITGFIRSDHGYWAAQLVEPYVDEEVSWAIRYHQALRFYPDESVGYQYPELYKTLFGEDYQPEPGGARAQVVHDVSPHHRERPLLLRSERHGTARRVHRHHRAELHAAEGRPRVRREPLRPHVADHQLADALPVVPARG